MKTVIDVLQLSASYLADRFGTKRDVEEMISHVLKMSRSEVYMNFDRPMNETELTQLRFFVKERAKGVPLEYVLGYKKFYEVDLELNENVLIPRMETEILVDHIVKRLQNQDLTKKVFWDICTGSGAIGLAIKKRFNELSVTLSDICEKALSVAKKNAERNGLNVQIIQGDLLKPFQNEKADFIVSNPPYIGREAWSTLDKSVREHEPEKALVGGQSGTEFYQRFSRELAPFIKKGSNLYFEIGFDQGKEVQDIFLSSWGKGEIVKDWAGHDRFFFLEIE